MRKMRWKRLAAFALAVMLFAGAVPAAAPVQGRLLKHTPQSPSKNTIHLCEGMPKKFFKPMNKLSL